MSNIFFILAAVCFALAAFRVPGPVDWVPAGYAFITVGLWLT